MNVRSPVFYACMSIVTSIFTIVVKFAAYFLTGSVGLLSDALESFVNLAAALIALATLSYAHTGADEHHNFGREKAEYFSSGIEGALIFVAAGAIVYSAVPRLMAPQPIEQVGLGLVLTAGVIVGVGLVVFTGWLILDPLIAIAVACQILWTGYRLMRRSFDGLMDRAIPKAERDEIEAVLVQVKSIGGDYHRLRTRAAGKVSFVDVHVLVPGAMSVLDGHDFLEKLETEIRVKVPHVEVLTHLEPMEDPRSWEDGKP